MSIAEAKLTDKPLGLMPNPPAIPGVSMANARAQAWQRRIALTVVVVPLIGLAAAVVSLWGRGIGPVDLGLLAVMYFFTSIGIGIGYHRLISHGSFKTPPLLRAAFGVLGSMAAQGPVFFWAAIHRRHHSTSDRPGDPHSPYVGFDSDTFSGFVKGLWHAHVGWLFVHEVTDWGRYSPDLLRDPLLLRVNRHYFGWVMLGLVIPAILGGMLTRSWEGALSGFLWGGLVRVVLVHHVTWGVNSICHVYGTQPFRAPDESRNNAWLALPSFGEGWHNNHHAFPYSAFHGLRWWEFDLNAWIIRSLQSCGLAWDLKSPTDKAFRDASLSLKTTELHS